MKDEQFQNFMKGCPIQLLILSDESSGNVFEKAIFEHNLFSLSKVYENIHFDSLKKHLNMEIDKVRYFNRRFLIIPSK